MAQTRVKLVSTQYFFVPAIYTGEDTTGKASSSWGMDLPPGVQEDAFGWGAVIPHNYVSGLKCTLVVLPGASGDVRLTNSYSVCGPGDTPSSNDISSGEQTISPLYNGQQAHLLELDDTGLTPEKGDVVRCDVRRHGDHIEDNLGGDLNVSGWLFEFQGIE